MAEIKFTPGMVIVRSDSNSGVNPDFAGDLAIVIKEEESLDGKDTNIYCSPFRYPKKKFYWRPSGLLRFWLQLGDKIMHNGEPYVVVSFLYVKATDSFAIHVRRIRDSMSTYLDLDKELQLEQE